MPFTATKLCLGVLIFSIPGWGQQSASTTTIDAATRHEIHLIEGLLPRLADRAPALFQLAHDYVSIGESARGLSLLKECVSLHEGFDPEGDPVFGTLKDNPEYKALVEQVRRDFPPVRHAKLAFTVPEKNLIPEGVAWDTAQHFFYLGSLSTQKIIKIRGGAATAFAPVGHDKLESICGIKVDSVTRDVWANTCRDDGEHAELLHFDPQGSLLERFSAKTQIPHLFNDLVLRGSDEIYLTDSLAQKAYRFDRKKHSFTALYLPRPLYYPNGIAISDAGNLLYISDAFGVLQYDLRTHSGREIQPGPSVTLSGFDGLYWYRGALVGIQNSLGMPRVVRFQLDSTGRKVTKTTVLEYRSDFVELPTTGAIVGSDFYFMANTQIDHWKNHRIIDPKNLAPIRVAVVHLD